MGPNQLLSDFGVDNVNDDKGRLQMFQKGQLFSWYIDSNAQLFQNCYDHEDKEHAKCLYIDSLLKASFLKAVQKKIEEIDETFHLVMILENFQVLNYI